MTWNDGRVWVLAASIGYRTGRIRMPDLNRNFGVGSDLAPRDFFHCIPDLDLELGPLKRWVLGHMCSRCLDNIILPIIARGALTTVYESEGSFCIGTLNAFQTISALRLSFASNTKYSLL